MNRQIKFRGIAMDTGEWAYGYFLQSQFNDKVYYIVPELLRTELITIIYKTLGQFVGIYDKDGSEIYEGDIIKKDNDVNYVVQFHHGSWIARDMNNESIHLSYSDMMKCTIIGNIHK